MLAFDREEEPFVTCRRICEKSRKERKTGQKHVKSGTLMLGKRDNVLSTLRDIPTPDYDSGAYPSTFPHTFSLTRT